MSTKKYLYCRPFGGLNDTLCQISRCLRFARKESRILIIDTQISVFQENIDYYFDILTDDVITKDVFFSEHYERVKNLSTNARVWLNRIILAPNVRTHLQYFQDQSDLDVLIIHECSGGGRIYDEIFTALRLKSEIKALIPKNFLLGKSYSALHVRNSDYKSDFKSTINRSIRDSKYDYLYIATDSQQVTNYIKLHDIATISAINVLHKDQSRYTHHEEFQESLEKKQDIIDMLEELIILTQATEIFTSAIVKPYQMYGSLSGFTLCVTTLRLYPEKAMNFLRLDYMPYKPSSVKILGRNIVLFSLVFLLRGLRNRIKRARNRLFI